MEEAHAHEGVELAGDKGFVAVSHAHRTIFNLITQYHCLVNKNHFRLLFIQ